jgi:hypothetical protein
VTELECITCAKAEPCDRHPPTEPAPPLAPSSSPVASFRVDDAGEVVPTETQPARDWYDWGLDTGPRIRPLRLIEGREYDDELAKMSKRADPVNDPAEDAAIFAESEKAFRDGDVRKLGKMYEDLLDEMHSPNLGERTVSDEWFTRAWGELEAALTAEIRELSRQERRYDWGYRVTDEGLSLRSVPRAGGDVLECRIDKKALKARVQQAAHDAKGSAQVIVHRARDEMKQARAALIINGPNAIPYEAEAS